MWLVLLILSLVGLAGTAMLLDAALFHTAAWRQRMMRRDN